VPFGYTRHPRNSRAGARSAWPEDDGVPSLRHGRRTLGAGRLRAKATVPAARPDVVDGAAVPGFRRVSDAVGDELPRRRPRRDTQRIMGRSGADRTEPVRGPDAAQATSGRTTRLVRSMLGISFAKSTCDASTRKSWTTFVPTLRFAAGSATRGSSRGDRRASSRASDETQPTSEAPPAGFRRCLQPASCSGGSTFSSTTSCPPRASVESEVMRAHVCGAANTLVRTVTAICARARGNFRVLVA